MTRTVCLAQNPDADALLASDMFALLTGMLLDQQIPMEKAFSGPKVLADRMGGLDVHRIADADPEAFATVMATPPAVHRFPGSMAKRVQAMAQFVVENYDGDVTRIWSETFSNAAKDLTKSFQNQPVANHDDDSQDSS